jgi:hypothetical protein
MAAAVVSGPHAEFESAYHQLAATAYATNGTFGAGCDPAAPCSTEDPAETISHEWSLADSRSVNAACGGASSQAVVSMNSGSDASFGGSTFTTIFGDVSAQSSATGDASYVARFSRTPESSSQWVFNVVGGTLNYTLSGSGVASGSAQVGGVFLKLYKLNPDNSGVRIHDFAGAGVWAETGTLAPGRYRIQLATNASSSASCNESQTISGSCNFVFTLTAPS